MAKKKKRRIQAPSLSPLDKGIYYLLTACSLMAGLFLYPVMIGNFRDSVFQDPRILAQNNPSIVILGAFGLFLGGGSALLLDWLRRKKQPIFGKSGITYGPPRWKPVYPVFSKMFRSAALKNKKRAVTAVSVSVLVVCVILIVTALGLPPRECLLDDSGIKVYNCFNENTVSYDPSDVAGIRIYTRTFHNRRGPDDWAIEMEIAMEDGERFYFSWQDFKTRDDSIRGCITGMLQIKACFEPGMVVPEGGEHIPDVIRDMNLNQQETEALYLLFDAEESWG